MPDITSDIQQHIERYRKLLDRDPDSRVFAPLAEACRKANRLEEALAVAEAGVRRHPTYASGRVALARAQLALDRYDDAAGELAEALVHAPENALAHRLLGEARVRLGDRAGAFDAYARALALNPEDEEAREALAGFEAQPEPAAPEPAVPETGGEVSAGPFPEAPVAVADSLEGLAPAGDEVGVTPEALESQASQDGLHGRQGEEDREGQQGEAELDLDLEPFQLRDPAALHGAGDADEQAPQGRAPAGAHSEPVGGPIDDAVGAPDPLDAPVQTGDTAVTDFGAAEISDEWGALDGLAPGQAAEAETSEEGMPEEGAPDDLALERDTVPATDGEAAPAGDADRRTDEPAFTGGVAEEDLSFEMGLPDVPPDGEDAGAEESGAGPMAGAEPPAPPGAGSIADAAMEPLSKRLEALDIAASSLAPEAREAVPDEAVPPESPGTGEDPPEEALPLDRRVEELADQYLRLGFPDRARALYNSLLAGNPMNLHAKRKLREMGPEAGPSTRAPAAGNQEVRRKVEENIDVLNRWLANIRKGAAR